MLLSCPPRSNKRRGSCWVVMGLVWTLAAAGCAATLPKGADPDFRRPGKAPVYRVSHLVLNAVCSSTNIAGCAACATGEIFISKRIKPGSAEFLRILEHEDEHIRLGCTAIDHCVMDKSLLSPKDYCEDWEKYLGIAGDE